MKDIGDMNVLEEALYVVHGPRSEDYGHPSANFDHIRPLWEGILGIGITDDQVAFCLIALKMARHLTTPGRDNLVDIAGYARVAEMVRGKREPGSWAHE